MTSNTTNNITKITLLNSICNLQNTNTIQLLDIDSSYCGPIVKKYYKSGKKNITYNQVLCSLPDPNQFANYYLLPPVSLIPEVDYAPCTCTNITNNAKKNPTLVS